MRIVDSAIARRSASNARRMVRRNFFLLRRRYGPRGSRTLARLSAGVCGRCSCVSRAFAVVRRTGQRFRSIPRHSQFDLVAGEECTAWMVFAFAAVVHRAACRDLVAAFAPRQGAGALATLLRCDQGYSGDAPETRGHKENTPRSGKRIRVMGRAAFLSARLRAASVDRAIEARR